jgi:hypothetical protein
MSPIFNRRHLFPSIVLPMQDGGSYGRFRNRSRESKLALCQHLDIGLGSSRFRYQRFHLLVHELRDASDFRVCIVRQQRGEAIKGHA